MPQSDPTQIEKAKTFKALHVPGDPLILYNIWDAGGAETIAKMGAKAIATGSHSVAAAQGYPDGEAIPLGFALQIVERIVQSIDLPLTVDFESGYAKTPKALATNVDHLIATGAIGLNFEDQIVHGEGLYPLSEQIARIAAIRATADAAGLPLFINARTDLFLKADPGDHAGLISSALDRAAAFAEAGADGFFVPGLKDFALIEEICQGTDLPVNVMRAGQTPIPDLARLGVARISHGPAPYRTAQADLAEHYAEI